MHSNRPTIEALKTEIYRFIGEIEAHAATTLYYIQ